MGRDNLIKIIVFRINVSVDLLLAANLLVLNCDNFLLLFLDRYNDMLIVIARPYMLKDPPDPFITGGAQRCA